MKTCSFIIPPPTESVSRKSKKFHRHFPPLSELICATALRKDGWNVQLFDLYSDRKLNRQEVIKKCQNSDVVVMTTNVYADWQCPSFDLEEAPNLAKEIGSPRLIVTGNHGTHYPKFILEKLGAWAVVRAEPEQALLQLCEAAMTNKKLNEIPNISFYDSQNQNVIHNPKGPLMAFEQMPKPAYDLVNLNNYYYELLGERFALLEAARGCPFSCNFCNRSMFDNKYRKKSTQQFLEEVDDLIQKYDCKSLYVFDLEFTINRKLVMDFCQHLINQKYQIQWACQTRADSVDEEMLSLMKQSGCQLIHFGVESGDEEILKSTMKRIKKEDILSGVRMAQKAGIKTAGFFIMGHPEETEAQLQRTLDFARELDLTYASFHPLLPFPGSPLFEKKFGTGPYWNEPWPEKISYFTPEQEQIVLSYVRKAFWSYFMRPKTILRLAFHGNPKLYLKQAKLFWNFLLT